MDMDRGIEYLAKVVPSSSGKGCFSVEMTPEQIRSRRIYIRQKLSSNGIEEMTDSQLDAYRYYELDGMAFYEDEEGRCFALGKLRGKDAAFRKANAIIPFEYLDVTLKDFNWNIYGTDTTEQKGLLGMYFKGFTKLQKAGKGMYICSTTKGSGKTMLACCILNELATRYACNIKFVNVLELLEMTKQSYSGQQSDFARIQNATILCIDDIGVQMNKEWVDTVLYRLINDRYCNHLVTIYTSNVLPEKLKIDDRITDRIEASSFVITLPEVSVRRIKSRAQNKALADEILTGKR